MSAIYDPPLDYDFGLDFDYSIWTEESEIAFLNVPWDATYREVVRFVDRTALNAYVDAEATAGTVLMNMSYVKPGQPIMIDMRHNVANRYNYIRVRNQLQPGGTDIQKDFYYFITGVEYIAPDTTAIYVQLDVWQTYIYDVQFGNCYVERGHIGIANANNFDAFGRTYLTVPEGIDVGSEYRTVTSRTEKIMGIEAAPIMSENLGIVVVASQDLLSSPINGAGKAVLTMTTGTNFETIFTGAGIYGFENRGSFEQWLIANKNYAWRVQSIKAIYMTPALDRYELSDYFDGVPSGTPVKLDGYNSTPLKHKFFPNWRDSAELMNRLPERYRHLRKFFTFPYMFIEMTTWSAAPIIIKPESWADPDGYVMERASLLPPSQRVEFIPRRYNTDIGSDIANWGGLPDSDPIIVSNPRLQEIGDDGGEYLDFAARLMNFPSVPIVSDTGAAYLASNQASIQQSYAAADWSQQRALTGNQLSFDQSEQNSQVSANQVNDQRRLNSDLNQVDVQRTVNNTNIGTAASIGGGLLMQGEDGFNPTALLGNGVSALASNASAAANIQSSRDALALSNAFASDTSQRSRGQEKYMRDTNLAYADYAAKGDYAQVIAGLDAKVRDAHMMQPAMSGQFGGEFTNLANNTVDVSLRWKMIDPSAIATIGEFWLQFGYAVHRSVMSLPADLMVMSKFTYWKLAKTYIRTAPMPEPFRQTIRGILEKGVTVWRNPADIGFTDFADNTPLGGIIL